MCAWARADAAPWTESTGPWWTGYTSNRYGLILAVHENSTAQDARDDLCQLHSTSGEPAMASDEANMATNIGTVLWAIPIETKPTGMTYTLSRIR